MSLTKARGLSPTENAELVTLHVHTLAELALPGSASIEQVLEAINHYLHAWRNPVRSLLRKVHASDQDPEAVAFGLGVLWGQQVVARYGWNWVMAQVDGEETLAVASPGRDLALYPVKTLFQVLTGSRDLLDVADPLRVLGTSRRSALPPGCMEDVLNEAVFSA